MKKSSIAAALVMLVGAISAQGYYTNIVIDGAFDDWDGVPIVATDPAGDNGGGPDLATLQIANDESNVYLRIVYHASVNPNAGPSVFLAVDNDVDTGSGFDVFGLGLVGSEAGWQNDFPFQQTNGNFNSGAISNGSAAIAPYFTLTTNQEYSISRSAIFESDGSPVFPSDTFRILVYTDFTPANEVMGPVIYVFPAGRGCGVRSNRADQRRCAAGHQFEPVGHVSPRSRARARTDELGVYGLSGRWKWRRAVAV